MGTVSDGIEKILFTEAQIQEKVSDLAKQVTEKFSGKVAKDNPLLCICILKGAFVFTADMVRQMNLPLELDFIRLSSYKKGTDGGKVDLLMDMKSEIEGRHVLVLEDIIDTGSTLAYLKELLEKRRAAGISFCVLVDKTPRRKKALKLDFVGFKLEKDEFVAGYGLDYAEKYRNLPHIGALKR